VTFRIIRKNGSAGWLEQRSVTIYDDAGRPTAIEGIARDITERRELLEQLNQSRNIESLGPVVRGATTNSTICSPSFWGMSAFAEFGSNERSHSRKPGIHIACDGTSVGVDASASGSSPSERRRAHDTGLERCP
jgi:hypothetical protein